MCNTLLRSETNKAHYEAHKDEYLARSKKYYEDHKEEVKARNRAYNKAHREEINTRENARPVRQRARNIKARYGLSLAEFETIKDKQRGVCAVCGCTRKLLVDHCHTTGRVRGLLCQKCNTGIGFLGDDLNGLTKAVQYLSLVQVPE
jgi:hypothetical protein